MAICPTPGCPNFTAGGYCKRCSPTSTRNHRGVSRHARGHGRDHDRAVRSFRAEPRRCELALEGCTGWAQSSDYSVPGDWTSRRQPACLHCQRVQGAKLAAAARV